MSDSQDQKCSYQNGRQPQYGHGPDGRICYRLKVKDSQGNERFLPNPLRIKSCGLVNVSFNLGDEDEVCLVESEYCETIPEANWIFSELESGSSCSHISLEEKKKGKDKLKNLPRKTAEWLGLRKKDKRHTLALIDNQEAGERSLLDR